MRTFLDTNVLFDILARRTSFKESCTLLVPHAFGDVELWVSAKSYTDIFYVLSKQVSSIDIQKAFIKSYEVFNICSVTTDHLMQAATRMWPDFEDCLIHTCAQSVNADIIITRDINGFKASNIPTSTPAQLLDILKEQGLEYSL